MENILFNFTCYFGKIRASNHFSVNEFDGEIKIKKPIDHENCIANFQFIFMHDIDNLKRATKVAKFSRIGHTLGFESPAGTNNIKEWKL